MAVPMTAGASLKEAGFRGAVQEEEPLAPFTTWQIGGPAEVLATPADEADLSRALAWAAERAVPWRVLGNGSNLLVHDSGVRGLVLRIRKVLSVLHWQGQELTAGAGASFPAVANAAAARGLAGLEFAAGIPGSVGGAIVMNAGWHEHETGNRVREVMFMHGDGRRESFHHARCAFAYRSSVFRRLRGLVLSARFRLQAEDPAIVAERLETFADSRKAHQPVDKPTCGSVYVQPPGDYAGRLIEAAGLKGMRIGNMEVSRLHANFFINLGGGTCAEALALMDQVEREVLRHSGVQLVREVEVWA